MAMTSPAGHMHETIEEFAVVDRDAVLEYLTTRQELVPFLAQLVHRARSIYGVDTTVSLRRDWDPDSDTDLEFLIAGVRTTHRPEDAYQLLAKMRDDWWFSVPNDVENQILVVNEFE